MNGYLESSDWKNFISAIEIAQWTDIIASWLQKNKFFSEKYDIEQSVDSLLLQGVPQEILTGLHAIFSGGARNTCSDPIEIPKARYLVGKSLGKLLMKSSESALSILGCVEDFLCWEGFYTSIDDFLREGKESLDCFVKRFHECLFSMDVETYCDIPQDKEYVYDMLCFWGDDCSLKDVFQPRKDIFLHIPAQNVLRCLLPGQPQIFLNLLDLIPFPSIIRDILWETKLAVFFPQLLELSPSCQKEDVEEPTWNRSFLAPLILITALNYGSHLIEQSCQLTRKPAEEELRTLYRQLAAVLANRSDRAVLSAAFQAEIQSRLVFLDHSNRAVPLKLMAEALASAMPLVSDITAEQMLQEIFHLSKDNANSIIREVAQTGRLQEENARVNISAFCAKLAFAPKLSPAQANAALVCFNTLLCFKKSVPHAPNNINVSNFWHKRIAGIYAAMANPADTWEKTWRQLSGIRHRLRLELFNDDCQEQRNCLAFMIACGLALYTDLRCSKKRQEADELLARLVCHIDSIAAWDIMMKEFCHNRLGKKS